MLADRVMVDVARRKAGMEIFGSAEAGGNGKPQMAFLCVLYLSIILSCMRQELKTASLITCAPQPRHANDCSQISAPTL